MPSSAQKVSQDIAGRSNPNWSSGGSSSVGSSASDMFDKYAAMIKANAAENNAWSAQQAQINRDWQERMSNTAHQREVADLKKAGLNPVLSVNGGQGAATTSGATASTDTSANSAIAGILGSILQSQVSLENQRLSAQTNLAVAEKYNAMSKYTAELGSATNLEMNRRSVNAQIAMGKLSAQTALSTASIQATTSRWVAQLQSNTSLSVAQINKAAQITSAQLHASATRYAADKGYLSAQNVANINAAVNRELNEKNIKAQFDFAEAFPSNIWQADPERALELADQDNMRDWIYGGFGAFRDAGLGFGGFTGGLNDAGLFSSAKRVLGFRG